MVLQAPANLAAPSVGRARSSAGESVLVLALAVATGVVGGLGAIAFRLMIAWVARAFAGGEGLVHGSHAQLAAVLAPAAGLLAVCLITQRFAREVRGHGVPQILEALALRGGRIRPRVGLFGILAPAITIGSGGSVGREGPIALIGGAFGSALGQMLRLPDRYVSLLLACGSAAGIGATFNAPIAGGFFGLEVILGTYRIGAMVPVFLASVAGVATFSAIEGSRAVLAVPPYVPGSPLAVFAAIALGLVGAMVGLGYTRGLDGIERLAERVGLSPWTRAALGGVLVGVLGLFVPEVLGVGYGTIHRALVGQLPLVLLAGFFLAKFAATLITIGAGGSGGVFAPSLYLGAMVGGAYGLVLHALVPALSPMPQVYAVAGMATVFAAAAQAPFVAITILLEITGDYRLTGLVMAAAAISYFTYALITRDSMYTVRLTRRGIKIRRGNDVRPLEAITVMAAIEPAHPPVPWHTSLREAHRLLGTEATPALAVAARDGGPGLPAFVRLTDMAGAVAAGDWEAPVGDFARPPSAWARPDDSLDDAMRLMALDGTEVLAVVSAAGELEGFVTVQGVMRLYHRSTLPGLAAPAGGGDAALDRGAFVQVRLGSASPFVGRRLSEVVVPPEAIVVSIERDEATFAPHGTSVFLAGDRVMLFVSPASEAARVRAALATEAPQRPS